MAPCRVPAGLRNSGVTVTWTTPAAASSTSIPAASRSGSDNVDRPVNICAATAGVTCGFGGSAARRGTVAKPMAPQATAAPLPSPTSNVLVTDRLPRRTTVLVASNASGAGTGRIRSDRSVVSVQTSGDSSIEMPATASTA